jgi:hypothetical protein
MSIIESYVSKHHLVYKFYRMPNCVITIHSFITNGSVNCKEQLEHFYDSLCVFSQIDFNFQYFGFRCITFTARLIMKIGNELDDDC